MARQVSVWLHLTSEEWNSTRINHRDTERDFPNLHQASAYKMCKVYQNTPQIENNHITLLLLLTYSLFSLQSIKLQFPFGFCPQLKMLNNNFPLQEKLQLSNSSESPSGHFYQNSTFLRVCSAPHSKKQEEYIFGSATLNITSYIPLSCCTLVLSQKKR